MSNHKLVLKFARYIRSKFIRSCVNGRLFLCYRCRSRGSRLKPEKWTSCLEDRNPLLPLAWYSQSNAVIQLHSTYLMRLIKLWIPNIEPQLQVSLYNKAWYIFFKCNGGNIRQFRGWIGQLRGINVVGSNWHLFRGGRSTSIYFKPFDLFKYGISYESSFKTNGRF